MDTIRDATIKVIKKRLKEIKDKIKEYENIKEKGK